MLSRSILGSGPIHPIYPSIDLVLGPPDLVSLNLLTGGILCPLEVAASDPTNRQTKGNPHALHRQKKIEHLVRKSA